MKPQAARFRIWEYRYDQNGCLVPIGEVKLGTLNVAGIRWNVHLANKKAETSRSSRPKRKRVQLPD